MSFDVPILFLVFNRPETTARVFEKIREIKPQRLFVAADGPREGKEGEKEKCQAVRDLVLKNIDWPCEVKTLLRDQNLGCGKAISGAITWFFENVEEGIILEDDTLPATSFFNFCKELLERYRDDSQVKIICGGNYVNRIETTGATYYFTAFPHIWGWATWKRTWNEYDFMLASMTETEMRKILATYFVDNKIIESWMTNFKLVKEQKVNAWDFQLGFSILKKSGFNAVTKINMISNIGFGNNATHTVDFDSRANLPITEITEIIHPAEIKIDKIEDRQTEKKVLEVPIRSKFNSFVKRINRIIKARFFIWL